MFSFSVVFCCVHELHILMCSFRFIHPAVMLCMLAFLKEMKGSLYTNIRYRAACNAKQKRWVSEPKLLLSSPKGRLPKVNLIMEGTEAMGLTAVQEAAESSSRS